MKLWARKDSRTGALVISRRGRVVYHSKGTATAQCRSNHEVVELTAGENAWLDEEVQPLLMQLASYKQFMVTMAASLADFARERMAFEKALREARDGVE